MMRLLLMMLMLLPASLFAADDSNVSPKIAKQIRKQINNISIDAIRHAPISGLYEIQSGGNIYYVDGTGKHLVANGHIFDTTTRQDLTAVRLEQINRIDWKLLPLDKAIVSGDPEGIEMAVFTDPDCPYCRKFETNLKSVKGVKVYTFLLPLTQLHPEARKKSEAIWCSKDQHKAMLQVMLEGKSLASGTCKTPLDEIAGLASRLNIHGTPTLIARDGRKMGGMPPAGQLKTWLNKK